MQLNATTATGTGSVLASQTIDISTSLSGPGGVIMRSTEREYRLAGATGGIDVFSSVGDAIAAARQLSAGEMPGLAVMSWRGGFRIHDVHAVSRTYVSSSPHGHAPPMTRETARSSVPFAAGNLRDGYAGSTSSPAVTRTDLLRALVDGPRVFVPTSRSWAGLPMLGEVPQPG